MIERGIGDINILAFSSTWRCGMNINGFIYVGSKVKINVSGYKF